MQKMDKSILFLSGTLALLLISGTFLPSWFTYLTAISLAKGLVVVGLVLLKRAGLVSFGQGLYFCIGGYTVGIAGEHFGISDAFLLIFIALSIAGLVSILVGLLLCRYREIFFAMLSMAFSMILYGALVKTEMLGSTDGFNVVSLSFLGWLPAPEQMGQLLYSLACLLAFVVAIVMHRYFQSGMGWAGEAIRENEIRVEYLGVSPKRVVYYKYVLAALLASLGGVLVAFSSGHVDPEMAYWSTSGEFVFMTLLGGTLNVAAPFVGAFIYELIRTYAFDLAPYTWQMILGVMLLLIILFLPNGLWSLMTKRKCKGA